MMKLWVYKHISVYKYEEVLRTHMYTYIKMQMLVLFWNSGYKAVEELGCLSMSMKLLLSAVQRDFEMEILLRRSELGALKGCERETDDTISSGRFPHA